MACITLIISRGILWDMTGTDGNWQDWMAYDGMGLDWGILKWDRRANKSYKMGFIIASNLKASVKGFLVVCRGPPGQRAESPGFLWSLRCVFANAADDDWYMIWYQRIMRKNKYRTVPELREAFSMNNRIPHDLSNDFWGRTRALREDVYS